MKYLKTFEKQNIFKYKVDDYVKLINDDYPIFAIILDSRRFIDMSAPSYYTEIIYFGGNNWNRSWTDEDQIERKVNDDEMSDIAFSKVIKKYNL